MSYSGKTDPIFFKLHKSCITALNRQGVFCVEQLFGFERKDLLALKGIGHTKADEIIDLLHELPFDYMSKGLPANPQNYPYHGVSEKVANELRMIDFKSREEFINRGINYFIGNKVESVVPENKEETIYRAKVRGTKLYNVILSLHPERKKSKCNCPYAKGWNSYNRFTCKHVVAALLELAYRQRTEHFTNVGTESSTYRRLSYMLKGNSRKHPKSTGSKIVYLLTYSDNSWDLYPNSIYKKVNSQLDEFQMYRMYGYTSPWQELKPQNSTDKIIVNYLRSVYESQMDPYAMSGSTNKRIGDFADIFELLRGEKLKLKHESDSRTEVYVSPRKYRLSMNLMRFSSALKNEKPHTHKGIELTFSIISDNDRDRDRDSETIPISECQLISDEPCWVYHNGEVLEIGKSNLLANIMHASESEKITITEEDLSPFFQDLFPDLIKSNLELSFEDELVEEINIQPVPRLYLRESGQELFISLKFGYDVLEIEENLQSKFIFALAEQNGSTADEIRINRSVRDFEAERLWLAKLQDANLTREPSSGDFTPTFNALQWVIDQLPQLAKAGFEIYGEDDLKRFSRPRKMTSKSFRISSGENWFEMDGKLDFEGHEINLKDIQDVLVPGTSYIKLSGNRTGEVPELWLNKLKKILHLTDTDKDTTRIPKIMANQLEDLLEDANSLDVDDEFSSYVKRLKSFDRIEEANSPKEFKGELRPYQKAGLSWLNFLREYNFGGILADDMGLGKTVQVLAFIQKIAEDSGDTPKCLIVAPRSVIQNWQAEATTFAPELNVYIHHGPDRSTNADEWPEASLIITTYSTLRIDIATFKEITFDIAVLDESHSMRNPVSQTFKSIRLIQAKFRLCLTGTPVQNTVMDLWTQFHFLNPGLIGNQTHFLNKWVKPIEKYDNKDAGEMLQKMVAPFILRRTKKNVAKDLPSLTSSIVHCPMEPSQKKVYEKHRKVYYDLINKKIDDQGLRESRFAVLEGLTRLRQICCSPQLIKAAAKDAAKVNRFLELAEELISEGHRALVFSQFVQFLKILEHEIKKRKWSYEYLDGKTQDRQERVDRFQKDSTAKLFLISLKAGGEGLNLTAADYVFIMDPWWNPAAERQAMDRTHRIGQTENVFVYRMVCPDTVEEKILKLQDRKQKLSEQLITPEAGIFKELNREELLGLFE
ncbi:MAG: DEAD/DEAH box helicase [Balneolales bacterium]|nr:DEAD/DEAH box helicase [Balneolales bacterium]